MRDRAHTAAVSALLFGQILREQHVRILLRPTPRTIARALMLLVLIGLVLLWLRLILTWVIVDTPVSE